MRKSERSRPYPPAFLNEDDLARELSCAPETVRRYVRDGLLPSPVRLGNLVRYRWTDVLDRIDRLNPAAGEEMGEDGAEDEYSGRITRLKAAAKANDDRAA